MQKFIWLAVAGALGTISRYTLAGIVQKAWGPSFPLGTLAVNVAGCFVAGLLWALFENRWAVTGETRVVVLVGFMGAFTTFSAYMLETSELVRSAEWAYAAANLGIQNCLGFIAVVAGVAAGRMF